MKKLLVALFLLFWTLPGYAFHWDGAHHSGSELATVTTTPLNLAQPSGWAKLANPAAFSQFMNPATYAQFMGPQFYAQFMNPSNWMSWMNPASYEPFMKPEIYTSWMNPAAYSGYMNPTAYLQWAQPVNYTQFMNPMTYMQWMNPTAFSIPGLKSCDNESEAKSKSSADNTTNCSPNWFAPNGWFSAMLPKVEAQPDTNADVGEDVVKPAIPTG